MFYLDVLLPLGNASMRSLHTGTYLHIKRICTYKLQYSVNVLLRINGQYMSRLKKTCLSTSSETPPIGFWNMDWALCFDTKWHSHMYWHFTKHQNQCRTNWPIGIRPRDSERIGDFVCNLWSKIRINLLHLIPFITGSHLMQNRRVVCVSEEEYTYSNIYIYCCLVIISREGQYYIIGTISQSRRAATWDFQQCCMCNQQSLRSACAYAQSDQNLCKLLEYFVRVKLLTEQYLELLNL